LRRIDDPVIHGEDRTDIQVIVLCKDEAHALRTTLEAILAQEVDGTFAVTVIDSGSTDGSDEIAESLPVRLIRIKPEEFHHARTRNLGAEANAAPVIVYVNAHVLPVSTSWLQKLTAPLRAETDDLVAGAYGQQIPNADAYPMERFMLERLYGPNARVQRAVPGQRVEYGLTLFSTANCAIRRDLWALRPFSDHVPVAEDQEWSRFWLEHGYAIAYVPEAAVLHSHNFSLGRIFHRYYGFGVSSELSFLPRVRHGLTPFVKSGLAYLAQEAVYLVRHGRWYWLPRAAMYEFVKLSALILGRQSWIPKGFRQGWPTLAQEERRDGVRLEAGD
jgi:rhamnosyltransferase